MDINPVGGVVDTRISAVVETGADEVVVMTEGVIVVEGVGEEGEEVGRN